MVSRFLNEFLHQNAAQPFATVIFVNVDRVLDRVFVGWPSPERAVAGKAKKLVVWTFKADYGKLVRLLGFEPWDHRIRTAGLVVEQRGRSENCIVEDVENLRCVPVMGAKSDIHDAGL